LSSRVPSEQNGGYGVMCVLGDCFKKRISNISFVICQNDSIGKVVLFQVTENVFEMMIICLSKNAFVVNDDWLSDLKCCFDFINLLFSSSFTLIIIILGTTIY
jgi:hypothetical protein